MPRATVGKLEHRTGEHLGNGHDVDIPDAAGPPTMEDLSLGRAHGEGDWDIQAGYGPEQEEIGQSLPSAVEPWRSIKERRRGTRWKFPEPT
jgi:hypothetical protein